jgi:hypothetical protein
MKRCGVSSPIKLRGEFPAWQPAAWLGTFLPTALDVVELRYLDALGIRVQPLAHLLSNKRFVGRVAGVADVESLLCDAISSHDAGLAAPKGARGRDRCDEVLSHTGFANSMLATDRVWSRAAPARHRTPSPVSMHCDASTRTVPTTASAFEGAATVRRARAHAPRCRGRAWAWR